MRSGLRAAVSLHYETGELRDCFRLRPQRHIPVAAPDGLSGVPAYGIQHAIRDANLTPHSLEQMTPAMVWRNVAVLDHLSRKLPDSVLGGPPAAPDVFA